MKMGFSLYYSTGVCMRVRPEFGVLVPVVCSERKEPGAMRLRVLRKVDNELAKGNTKTALSLVKQLQGKPGGLRGFGGAKQVPMFICFVLFCSLELEIGYLVFVELVS